MSALGGRSFLFFHFCIRPGSCLNSLPPGLRSSPYFGLPQVRLNCIDRVMRAAARLVGRIQRFGNLSEYMRDVLHWLPPQQRIFFRISSLVWRSVLGRASSYLQVLLTLTSSCLGRSSLRSASRGDFMVPHAVLLLSSIGLSRWSNPQFVIVSHLTSVPYQETFPVQFIGLFSPGLNRERL